MSTRVGQNAVWNGTTAISGATSLWMTTQAGDVIYVWALRNGSNTPPTNGTGYTSLSAPTGTGTVGGRLSKKVSPGGETTIPQFTNSTAYLIWVVRPDDATSGLTEGAILMAAGTSATISWQALTLNNTDGLSDILGGALHKTATNLATATPPTSYTRTGAAGTSGGVVGIERYDTNSGALASMVTSTSGTYYTLRFEFRDVPSSATPGVGSSAGSGAAAATGAAVTSSGGGSGPTWSQTDKSSSVSLSSDKLTAINSTGQHIARSSVSKSTGKFYVEDTLGAAYNIGSTSVGIANGSASLEGELGNDNNSLGIFGGQVWTGGSNVASGLDGWDVGFTRALALDFDAKLLWVRRWNGTSWGAWNGDPAAGTGGVSFANITGPYFIAAGLSANSETQTANFGASASIGTPPTGFSTFAPATGTSGAGTAAGTSAVAGVSSQKPAPYDGTIWNNTGASYPTNFSHATRFSASMQTTVGYSIYLPPGYSGGTSSYPVIYFLHGRDADENTEFYRLQDYISGGGTPPNCIVVWPNGGRNSKYMDPEPSSPQYGVEMGETNIVELVAHIDATYRTIADRAHRSIQGFSMGGQGAARLGVKYNNLFGSLVALTPIVTDAAYAAVEETALLDAFFLSNANLFEAQNAVTQVSLHADEIRGTLPIYVQLGGNDMGNQPYVESFVNALNSASVANTYAIIPGLGHAYTWGDNQDFAFANFGSTPSVVSGAGASAGAGTITGAGTGLRPAAGSAAGLSTLAAVGASTRAGAGSSAGIGIASASATAIRAAAGSSVGAGTAAASAIATQAAAGAASGAATATSAGTGVSAATGAAAGVSSGGSTGAATQAATGAAAGLSLAGGAAQAVVGAAGVASGLGALSGVGRATAAASGASVGSAASAGVGSFAKEGASAGASAGQASAAAAGSSIAAGAGLSAGASSAASAGRATAAAVGLSAGASSANATTQNLPAGKGQAAGAGAAQAVGQSISAGAGVSASSASCNAAGTAIRSVAGVAAGASAAIAVGSTAVSIVAGAGASAGFATGAANANAISSAAGQATGQGAAAGSAIGLSTRSGVGQASGSALVNGSSLARRRPTYGFRGLGPQPTRPANVSGQRRPPNLSTAVR